MTGLLRPRGASPVRDLRSGRTAEATALPNRSGATRGAKARGGGEAEPAAKGECERPLLFTPTLHTIKLMDKLPVGGRLKNPHHHRMNSRVSSAPGGRFSFAPDLFLSVLNSPAALQNSEGGAPGAGGASQRPPKDQSRRKDEAKQAAKKPKENALSQFDLNNYASESTPSSSGAAACPLGPAALTRVPECPRRCRDHR